MQVSKRNRFDRRSWFVDRRWVSCYRNTVNKATLVAKHECGFALWPTKAASGGFAYNYSVPDNVDIVQQVAESCARVGVKLGLYYSV